MSWERRGRSLRSAIGAALPDELVLDRESSSTASCERMEQTVTEVFVMLRDPVYRYRVEGRILVRGLVESAARRDEIASALSGHELVDIELTTPQETSSSPAALSDPADDNSRPGDNAPSGDSSTGIGTRNAFRRWPTLPFLKRMPLWPKPGLSAASQPTLIRLPLA